MFKAFKPKLWKSLLFIGRHWQVVKSEMKEILNIAGEMLKIQINISLVYRV